MNPNPVRRGFTLVELLAVMILMSLLAAMVFTATNGVIESAKEARTKKIIAAIDSVIQEKYRSYKYLPLAVEIPETSTAIATAPANEIGYEVLANEAARVRLMMIRDLQRMELPDRFSDIAAAPSLIRAAANPVVTSGGAIVGSRVDKLQRRMMKVTWYDNNASYAAVANENVPAKLAAYRQRIRDVESLNPGAFDFVNPLTFPQFQQNQGAECLYLIMATSYVAAGPAIDVIPAANIDDTDGDGLLEILDGWGQPLDFVRWPVGVADFEQSAIVAAAPTVADPNRTPVPDDFDHFRADYAYAAVDPTVWTPAVPINVNTLSAGAGTPTDLRPWSMRPLIFSRGPNRVSGMATNPWTSAAELPAFSYRASVWNWPLGANYYGTELGGRDRRVGPGGPYTEHPFPDPYLRRFVASNGGMGFAGLFPGQLLAGPSANEDAADNITNYQLQATPR